MVRVKIIYSDNNIVIKEYDDYDSAVWAIHCEGDHVIDWWLV